MKRAGASARTSEHDRPIFMNLKTISRRGSPRGEGRSPVECNIIGKIFADVDQRTVCIISIVRSVDSIQENDTFFYVKRLLRKYVQFGF